MTSELFDESTFYRAFINDLQQAKREIIVESPYISSKRMAYFRPLLDKVLRKGVKIYIFTRDPLEHEADMAFQSEIEISNFERIGVQTFICSGNHHRKLAILDREVLWEGSLNIFSQAYSREVMRRIHGKDFAVEMFDFLKLGRFI